MEELEIQYKPEVNTLRNWCFYYAADSKHQFFLHQEQSSSCMHAGPKWSKVY